LSLVDDVQRIELRRYAAFKRLKNFAPVVRDTQGLQAYASATGPMVTNCNKRNCWQQKYLTNGLPCKFHVKRNAAVFIDLGLSTLFFPVAAAFSLFRVLPV
jgi:hypothetical protein